MSNTVTRRWMERTQWRLTESVMLCGQQIPTGFTTDGVSVPRLLLQMPDLRRADTDRQFLQVMCQMGVARWCRLAMFAAVRLWGSVKEVLRG